MPHTARHHLDDADIDRPQAISGHKGRDQWICAILTRDVLPLLEVRVAVRLGIFFNCKTGKCDPGYDTLASELGISRRTLFRALARLKADGWIAIHRVGRDEYVQFSLFIPSQLASPNETLPAGGASMLSPQEVPAYWHLSEPPEPPHEVTENGVRGDRNRGLEVTDRLAAQKNLKPENLKSAALHAARTSRVVRDSPSNSTSDDAAISAPDRPVPRAAADAARQQPVATQKQPSPERDATEPGTAANGADADGFDEMRRAQIQDVRRLWPRVRVDEGKAFPAFLRAMAGRRLSDVIEAVHRTLVTSGDVPWLSEALTLVERNLATTTTNEPAQEDEQ